MKSNFLDILKGVLDALSSNEKLAIKDNDLISLSNGKILTPVGDVYPLLLKNGVFAFTGHLPPLHFFPFFHERSSTPKLYQAKTVPPRSTKNWIFKKGITQYIPSYHKSKKRTTVIVNK